ncbi:MULTISPECIES: TonB-dependent receptor plug domain-containing protein [unclassified Sphingobium]|uniref:TonB-dependent receptor plug domain-containing protein n=1 Tax=unclassified Sphingobium TaxID=2611147 RepID=UPI002224DA0A|nr:MULTISPECIES: TonB-dependent receptor plug domain-containing protein [unclassified Sphingobium]MCW2394027.1 outer membrane receptor protein involved in Fe transport [Sphingobium sp. B8D3B]MCW2417541.1 outer membrane receptor protein involved in Fe transport [Sphingobium sp. B8D3C]
MISTSLATMICCSPASAQTGPQQAAEQNVGLDVIVVTAQRKSEDVQRAAVPINVVSSKDLATAGAADTTVLNKVAPSLFISRGGGALTSFFIRGVGNFTNNSFSDPAVAFNYDGVYVARPSATASTFFDLERIEVLKGPQGTLYGRNATRGAVNLIPARPQFGTFAASGSFGYGNYNAFDLEGMANAPLGEDAAIRLSGRMVKNDGYNADGTDDTNVKAVRG